MIFPAWATYVMDHDVGRFVQFAVNVWGVNPDGKTEKQTAVEGIERCKTSFLSLIHIQMRIRDRTETCH